jgi:hypothetical protein
LIDDPALISVSQIYKVRPEQLKKIFVPSEMQQKILLEQHGMVKGIMKKLASDPGTGIIGDNRDLKRRR